jgi:cobalt-zinc-cadmium efflux system protein
MGASHSHQPDSAAGIKVAFYLNLAFTVLELLGGLWTNSLAILSDSLHDLGDSFTLGLSWFLQRYSTKEGDPRYSYGYRRYSLLAALVSTAVLIIGSIFVISEAIPRLGEPQHSNAGGMVAIALLGIAANGYAALRVRGSTSMNARIVAWHLLEDVLGWIAVLIVGVTLLFRDIHILDPLLSILITAYVLYNVIRNLRKTFALFLQAVPEEVDLDRIEEMLLRRAEVSSLHHTHVWSLDGEHHVLTTHIVVPDGTAAQEIIDLKCDVRDLTDSMRFEHTTLEIEFESEDCAMRPAEPAHH